MKRLILAAILTLSSLSSRTQPLVGESSKIVTVYLELNQAKYHTVYDCQHKLALIVRDMDGGTAVYYFKDNVCISYTIVNYYLTKVEVERTFNGLYSKVGDHWCDAESADIIVTANQYAVFINVGKFM